MKHNVIMAHNFKLSSLFLSVFLYDFVWNSGHLISSMGTLQQDVMSI